MTQFKIVITLLLSVPIIAGSTIARRAAPRHDKFRKEHDGIESAGNASDATPSDSEVLFGKADAKTFEQLQPSEKRQRLSVIVSDKIDQNQDGYVTEEEMVQWISYVHRHYILEDTKQKWDALNITGDKLTWQAYKDAAYGKMDELLNATKIKDMARKELRRFVVADEDNTSSLTFEEFINFFHPEEAVRMRPTIMLDAMEDVDRNGDGFIDEDEYIYDMWLPEENREAEPQWVATERQFYRKWRDSNKDGKMSQAEVQDWVAPLEFNHTIWESQNLIRRSDLDKDGKLTVVEILNKFEAFVESEATDYGEALVRKHDEF